MNKHPNFRHFINIISGTFVLMLISFYNGYPLVYSDTGTYIASGFDLFVPNDRPIFYGLFIKVFSLKTSLWFVVIVQNLLTSYIIYEVFKMFFQKYLAVIFLTSLAILNLLTGIGWYSNQIMADLFIPIAILAAFILLFNSKLSKLKWIFINILLVFSIVVHLSHLLILVISFFVYFLIRWINKRNPAINNSNIPLRKSSILFFIIISGWLVIPTVNYIVERNFVVNKASHVFLMGHLADTGILEKFLKEKCNSAKYRDCKLCKYKDSIPASIGDFLWNESSPFYKTGGWDSSKTEYDKIIEGTLSDPKFLVMNFGKSVNYGLIELTKIDIGQGLTAYNHGSAPYGQINWRFNSELRNYENARQNIWDGSFLNFETLNLFQLILMCISLLALIFIFTVVDFSKVNPLSLNLLIWILISVIINAFFTAGLNSPCERFQARVIWLVPMAISIFLIVNWKNIFTKSLV